MDNGDLTSVDLAVLYLDRIQRYDVNKLNSVLELNPDVLEIAQTLDDERASGNVRGAMHGIPVLLKDNIATGDQMHTAAGAAALLNWDPARDAFLVSQLRNAGAVVLGKTNFTQFLTPESLADVRVGLPVWNDQAFEEYFAGTGITDEEEQQNLRALLAEQNESIRAKGDVLSAAGVTVVEFPITNIPQGATDVNKRLEYGFKQAINTFLADLGADAPVGSLEEIIAFNKEDLANRAPYGQGYLEAAQETAVTAEEFASLSQQDNGLARNALDLIFQNYDVNVILSDVGQLYAPAGYPALTVPSGYAEDGTPESFVFVGGFFSEPQLLAVGYAYEQEANARVAPDLEMTNALIEALDE